MGLTSTSTGVKLLSSDLIELSENSDYTVAIARKS